MNSQKTEAWRGQVRMPAPLAEWLKARADASYRTLNAEIVDLVLRAKEQAGRLPSTLSGTEYVPVEACNQIKPKRCAC